MMKKILAGLAVGMIMFGLTYMAQATVITFDDLETPGTGDWDFRYLKSYSYDGFNLNAYRNGVVVTTDPAALVYATQSSWGYGIDYGPDANTGSASVSLSYNSAWFDLTRQDGGLFSFDSIQVRGFYNPQASYVFNAFDSFDNLIATYTTGNTLNILTYHWTTFSFDSSFDSVAKVQWRSYSPGYNSAHFADNINATAIDPVPEPSTMLLLGSGLVGLVGFGRKRLKI